MNKFQDLKILPDGEYIDALNIRVNSTDGSDAGAVENTLGNTKVTNLQYTDGNALSNLAMCLGAFADETNEVMYWFVHDPQFATSPTGKLDLIVSYNKRTLTTKYHVLSVNDGDGINTTLNFDESYLIVAVDLVDDLLFFTDNYNPPRVININRAYPFPSGASDWSDLGEAIMVIKKPPTEAPVVTLFSTGDDEDFITDRFISFGTRYGYEDGENSAASQFSSPAFEPGEYIYSPDDGLNNGMVNTKNAAKVAFNSGGALVKNVDILFKDADDPDIKVAARLNKEKLGMSDNTTYYYDFTGKKISSVLPSSEIGRLFDNVPHTAKAQSILGNRLIYGNYVDGFDLKDSNGNDVKIEFEVEGVSTEVSETSLPITKDSGLYSYGTTVSVTDSIVEFDLANVKDDLVKGAALTFQITYGHAGWFGASPTDSPDTSFSWTFELPRDYSNVYDLASSQEFIDAVGSVTTKKLFADACDGGTMTDVFNCSVPAFVDSVPQHDKFESGITGGSQAIPIVASASSTKIGFQLPAVAFVDNVSSPTTYIYEYYDVVGALGLYKTTDAITSLHSSRGYEVGIVYMDEFNRSTESVGSQDNTVRFNADSSDTRNKIRVTIPETQKAPSWATRYKFVVKADRDTYETIVSNEFYYSTGSNDRWFLLEGENSRKVEEGDRLIVKSDSTGALTDAVYVTVLEKVAKESNFLGGGEPAGTYMKISAEDFVATKSADDVIKNGKKQYVGKDLTEYPVMWYNVGQYDIPAGSRIDINLWTIRRGRESTFGAGTCPAVSYRWKASFRSRANHASFKDWWDNENIGSFVNNGKWDTQLATTPTMTYNSSLLSGGSAPVDGDAGITALYEFQFYQHTGDDLYLGVTAVNACGTFLQRDVSNISMEITVVRTDNTVVFETMPIATVDNAFYEGSESFGINADGEHLGNTQDQDFVAGNPAIVDLDVFNCFAFGNGIESYKHRDSISGRSFNLGNRFISNTEQTPEANNNESDLTYSGTYNDESNVNRLNEFNVSLDNFKNLEDRFGSIQRLHAFRTDLLVLQENRISYVLTGKNLLSDSVGGGTVSSVPEVLGTQVARSEDYGIGENPESFAAHGPDMYFTDAKSGVVIKLTGSSAQNLSLDVISETGMQSWFRDVFSSNPNRQKIGAYDPFFDEYVLTMNDNPLPQIEICDGCGTSRTVTASLEVPASWCVDAGELVGDVVVTYNVISSDDLFNVRAVYDGGFDQSGYVINSGSFTVTKDKVSEKRIDMLVQAASGTTVIDINVSCPAAETITIVKVTLTNDSESGEQIHTEYRWEDGTFVSPLHSDSVQFQNGSTSPLASEFTTITGLQGAGVIPADGATVTMRTNKRSLDDFVFDSGNDTFKYLRTNTVYNNTAASLMALLASLNTATPIDTSKSPDIYSADFTMPSTGSYLYLVYDLRQSYPLVACQSLGSAEDACCGC